MLFSAKIKSLESAKEALETENQRLLSRVEQADTALNTITAERNTLAENLAAITGERDAEKARADAEKARADKAETSVGTKVVEQIASAGVPAIQRAPDAKTEGGKTMTREELNALPHAARAAHFRAGGKLTD